MEEHQRTCRDEDLGRENLNLAGAYKGQNVNMINRKVSNGDIISRI